MANNPPKTGWNIPGIITTIIIVIVAGAILYLLYYALAPSANQTLLGELAKVDVARGLITFLIAFGAVAIAIILSLGAILSSEDFKDRITTGKEVLTSLIGILGTIVGFYYGSSTTQSTNGTTSSLNQIPTIHIASTFLSKDRVEKGEIITISTFAYGGQPPYSYEIKFEPNVIPAVRNIVSQDGYIKQDINVPSSLKSDIVITLDIDVKDSKGTAITYNSEGPKTFLVTQK